MTYRPPPPPPSRDDADAPTLALSASAASGGNVRDPLAAAAPVRAYAPAGTLRPGQIVAGKYVVERIIGRGGVGVVAAARHVSLRQLVALKFLRPELATEPEVIARFVREAQAAAQLRSEHVARVMDAGTLDDGTAFVVFEYLEGRDLATVLREDGPLPIEAAVDYLTQACEAIGEAHALGIVHRDLKPANLFLTRTTDGMPFVKVLDFGLAKPPPSPGAASLTAHDHVIGSPHFMSPEQMRSSRDTDARSDIWTLGVVLFALLTGRVPFEGAYLTEVCAAVMSAVPPSLTALRPDVPPALEAIVVRCLALRPDARFASVADLAAALQPFAPAQSHARAGRIARVMSGAGRALGPGRALAASASSGASATPPSPAIDVPTSSPVSWSCSIGRATSALGVRASSSAPATAAPLASSAALATRVDAPSTATPATRPHMHRRALAFAAVGALLTATAIGAGSWLGQRDATPAAATRATFPPIAVSAAPAPPSADADGTASDHAPTPAQSARTEPTAPTPPSFARAPSVASAQAPARTTLAPTAPATTTTAKPRALPTPNRPPVRPRIADDQLILSLPH